jgi:hypothetical protein
MSYKGKINVYTCPAGHKTVTIDTDDGVTPMMMGCRQKADDGKHNCTEFARSAWYRCDSTLTPEYEWYKPESMKGLNKAEKEHVVLGGLLLRKIETKASGA